MCLTVPQKIIAIKNNAAKVRGSNSKSYVDLSYLTEKVKIGDYVLSQAGIAIRKIEAKEALQILKAQQLLIKETR